MQLQVKHGRYQAESIRNDSAPPRTGTPVGYTSTATADTATATALPMYEYSYSSFPFVPVRFAVSFVSGVQCEPV